MKAVRLYARTDLRVDTVDCPARLNPTDVRIAVTAAGICGSDLHNFRTGQWISRSPSTAGHEFCGIVIETGQAVCRFKPGDTVVADSRVTCGQCRNCREDFPQICEKMGFVGEVIDGGFAEQAILPETILLKANPQTDVRALAMAEPLAVALHAMKRLSPPQGAPIMIAGCGPIGALCAMLASKAGHPVIMADRNAARLNCVAHITSATTFEISTEVFKSAPRYAIDATGAKPVIESLVRLMAGGGALALVGIGENQISFSISQLVEKEITIIGCHAFRDELPEAIALCHTLQADLLHIIDNEIGLDDVPAAYDRIINGKATAPKTIITPERKTAGS